MKSAVQVYLKDGEFRQIINNVDFISFFRLDMERAQLNFVNKAPPKKKRKSRTAFTNHQVGIQKKLQLTTMVFSKVYRNFQRQVASKLDCRVLFYSIYIYIY